MAIKTKYRIIFGALGVFAVLGLGKVAFDSGLIPKPAGSSAKIPEKSSVTLSGTVNTAVPASYELPAQATPAPGPVRILSIPWNGPSSLTVANGGPQTARGSHVATYTGSTVNIERQDDYGVMKDELLKFSTGVANGQENPDGAAFVIIMGDAYAAFAQSMQTNLGKINQEIAAVGVFGFSYGEDKCMGKALNGNPKNAAGSVIAAVPYDGDFNICVKWASDNGIPVNVDQTTYDPTAINFRDTKSFVEADNLYIGGACENRDEAKGGLKTGKKVQACVDGVATWTPGDEAVVKGKPGVTTWASTREYNQQMPAILIGNKAWMQKNRAFVVGLLRAADRGAFEIRNGGEGLNKLGRAQAAVFGAAGGPEADPSFWSRYYIGEDLNGVRIGGSRAATLSEARDFLGLTTGSFNVYKGVYEVFGNYAKTFYPNDVPTFPAYDRVVDASYVQAALAGVNISAPTQTQFAEQKTIQRQVSSRAYSIQFDTGKATIRRDSMEQLFEIANQSGMTQLRIRISGHTDNTGNPSINTGLSRARAQAVADWLTSQAPQTFPATRMEVRGYGDMMPVEDNTTEAGRAKNRRVEIVLGE